MIAIATSASKSGKSGSISNSSSTSNSSSKAAPGFTERKACDILTAETAHLLAGADAKTNDAGSSPTNLGSTSVTICSYHSETTGNSVDLQVSSALNQAGADSNKAQFTSNLPSAAKKVQGYGDAAYWDSTFGQLNVLKHNNWYILNSGSATPAERTQSQAELFTQLIIDKL